MLIGRKEEQYQLNAAFNDEYSQFVVVYGRRRVGKTFLVRETFNYDFCFQHTGMLKERSRDKQLEAFWMSLKEYGHNCEMPPDWIHAFDELKNVIRASKKKRKLVFIDEIASMDTGKSGLVPALEQFWNGWCTARKDVVLVVCSSASSWIIKKVFRNKGGLHNRTTSRIHVRPFTLRECEEYISYRKFKWSRYQILNMYMVLGGVAYYWSLLDARFSPAQNIDSLFFAEDAKLSGEYDELYSSLFKNAVPYKMIIEALGKKSKGLTRQDLASMKGMDDSGTLTERLDELERCNFIRKYTVYPNKKKDAIYQLVDNYTLFYFKFILNNDKGDTAFWSHSQSLPFARTWSGLAFERVCLQHIDQIKQSLGISGVLTSQWAWRGQSSQIDLIIDRNDNIVNICEMKWALREYQLTSKDHNSLINKVEEFSSLIDKRKSIQVTMITSFGVQHGIYSDDYQTEVTMDDLFR